MLTADAERHFGTRAEIVRALGNRTKAAIYHWGDVVPFAAALQLEEISKGKVKCRREMYDPSGRIVKSA
jgi:hypothetical protein